jgi:cation:H+ antiporter
VDILIALILLAVGIFLTVKGADLFIRSASWFGDVTAISKAVIGATVIAFATSAPEFFVSLFSSLRGSYEMSTANIVGSNICNLGIGFAIIAIFHPHRSGDRLFVINGAIMLISALFVSVMCLFGALGIWHAVVLLLILGVFTGLNIKFSGTESATAAHSPAAPQISTTAATPIAPTQPKKREKKPTNRKEILVNVIFFVVGFAGLLAGSEIIVRGATALAREIGVTEYIIGLTIVAIGTSLPELVTTVVAIAKRESGLSVGNLVGSNVFNITAILATVCFVSGFGGVAFSAATKFVDMPIVILFSVIVVAPTIIWRRVFRAQGVTLAVIYVGYIVYSVVCNA